MVFVGWLIVVFASVLHCWYSANQAAEGLGRARLFETSGARIFFSSIVLLISGLILTWFWGSLLLAAFALATYYLVLPIALIPLMEKIYRPEPPTAAAFSFQLYTLKYEAASAGKSFLDISARKLHLSLGKSSRRSQNLPVCCQVMRDEMGQGDLLLKEHGGGVGQDLTIRYILQPVIRSSHDAN